MTDKIKLSELRSSRAVMTPGPWTTDDDTPSIYGGNAEVGDFEIAVISEEAGNYEGDAPGIVATHNAADALIELAEAAVDLESKSDPRDWRNHTDEGLDATYAAMQRFKVARRRFEP